MRDCASPDYFFCKDALFVVAETVDADRVFQADVCEWRRAGLLDSRGCVKNTEERHRVNGVRLVRRVNSPPHLWPVIQNQVSIR
jgi:hypothetical protein